MCDQSSDRRSVDIVYVCTLYTSDTVFVGRAEFS